MLKTWPNSAYFLRNFLMLAATGFGSVYGAKWEGDSILSYLYNRMCQHVIPLPYVSISDTLICAIWPGRLSHVSNTDAFMCPIWPGNLLISAHQNRLVTLACCTADAALSVSEQHHTDSVDTSFRCQVNQCVPS